MRLPKQVLIIPYKICNEEIKYCIFKRKDMKIWQWIAGGAESFDKDILETAKRELWEETQIKDGIEIEQLELITKIPVVNIVKEFKWGKDIFYADEYAFSVNIADKEIKLSSEHEEYEWMNYEDARKLLKYDSNKSALWELNEKLNRKIK
jgi:dATP pyrophosphohydrolase